jgi:hypothetical protein
VTTPAPPPPRPAVQGSTAGLVAGRRRRPWRAVCVPGHRSPPATPPPPPKPQPHPRRALDPTLPEVLCVQHLHLFNICRPRAHGRRAGWATVSAPRRRRRRPGRLRGLLQCAARGRARRRAAVGGREDGWTASAARAPRRLGAGAGEGCGRRGEEGGWRRWAREWRSFVRAGGQMGRAAMCRGSAAGSKGVVSRWGSRATRHPLTNPANNSIQSVHNAHSERFTRCINGDWFRPKHFIVTRASRSAGPSAPGRTPRRPWTSGAPARPCRRSGARPKRRRRLDKQTTALRHPSGPA